MPKDIDSTSERSLLSTHIYGEHLELSFYFANARPSEALCQVVAAVVPQRSQLVGYRFGTVEDVVSDDLVALRVRAMTNGMSVPEVYVTSVTGLVTGLESFCLDRANEYTQAHEGFLPTGEPCPISLHTESRSLWETTGEVLGSPLAGIRVRDVFLDIVNFSRPTYAAILCGEHLPTPSEIGTAAGGDAFRDCYVCNEYISGGDLEMLVRHSGTRVAMECPGGLALFSSPIFEGKHERPAFPPKGADLSLLVAKLLSRSHG